MKKVFVKKGKEKKRRKEEVKEGKEGRRRKEKKIEESGEKVPSTISPHGEFSARVCT